MVVHAGSSCIYIYISLISSLLVDVLGGAVQGLHLGTYCNFAFEETIQLHKYTILAMRRCFKLIYECRQFWAVQTGKQTARQLFSSLTDRLARRLGV